MTIIAQNKRYLPHEITTKENSVKLYRKTKDISFVCRRYHISKASLMRWNKRYDGTRESLEARSHRPKRQHPRAHTEKELKWIRDYHRRNPDISVCELYGKLRHTVDIPDHCTACSFGWGTVRSRNPPKRNQNTVGNMRRRPCWGRNGSWT